MGYRMYRGYTLWGIQYEIVQLTKLTMVQLQTVVMVAKLPTVLTMVQISTVLTMVQFNGGTITNSRYGNNSSTGLKQRNWL